MAERAATSDQSTHSEYRLDSLEVSAPDASLQYIAKSACKRRYYNQSEAKEQMQALVGKDSSKVDFKRIALVIGCSEITVQRYHQKKYKQDLNSSNNQAGSRMSENHGNDCELNFDSESEICSSRSRKVAMHSCDATSKPARKQNRGLTSEEARMMWDLVPTIRFYTKDIDCQRIANVVGCGLSTVKVYHKKFLEMTGSAASTALVAAGPSSAPTRACVGGSGGAGAAPCWSAPQVIFQNSSLPIRPAAARPALRCSPHSRVTTAASRRPPDPSLRRRTPSAAFHAGSFRQRRQGPDAPTWRRRVCLPGFQIAARRHS
jgi:hypothetical protein